ncbi:MAG: hypothetical protein ACR2RD_00695 [Woeseiaceae bacterium]
MNRIGQSTLVLLLLVAASGCVSSRPLISHSHIGHALTTWHDTPDKQGLYTVAAKELDIAIAATSQALASTNDARQAGKHLDNALHALNPDLQRFGAGLDYGALRAMQGAIDHLEYAADSEDASDNFVSSVITLADQGDVVVHRLMQAQQAIVDVNRTDPAGDSQLRLAHQVLMAAKYGDPNGSAIDGTMARADQGLVHISAQLADMLAREIDPKYEPVPRKYVLGLVRLPSGRWGYRLAKPGYAISAYGY